MSKEIELGGKIIPYELKTSQRARRIRLSIRFGENLVVSGPRNLNDRYIENFLKLKSKWILAALEKYKPKPGQVVIKTQRGDYKKYKNQALAFVRERLEYFNRFYGFIYHRVSVKNQRTCWGSCSKKGNLNFNYKIIFLPPALADWIVVHELCHLKELNHSKKFWSLVAQTIPDWREIRQKLKKTRLLTD